MTDDDVEPNLTRGRDDELFRGTQLIGETAVLLSVLNLAAEQANGAPLFADVRLTADDVDVLITFLRRHVASLRHRQDFEMPQESGA